MSETASTPAAGADAGNLLSGAGNPAPPVSATPPPVQSWQWAAEDGKFNDGWAEKAGYKDNPTLATIRDVPTLAKAYLDTKAMIGKKVAPPGEGAKEEEIMAWRKLVGAPDKIDDYGSLMPDGFQKELWNGEMEKSFLALAHKHHLPPAVVKEIAALQAQGTQAIYETERQSVLAGLEKGRAELRQAWGEKFEQNAAAAKMLATALGIEESDDIFTTRPDILQKLAAAAPRILGGDKIVHGTPVGVFGGVTQQIEALMKGDDYQGKNGPQRQMAAHDQLMNLYETRDQAKKAA